MIGPTLFTDEELDLFCKVANELMKRLIDSYKDPSMVKELLQDQGFEASSKEIDDHIGDLINALVNLKKDLKGTWESLPFPTLQALFLAIDNLLGEGDEVGDSLVGKLAYLGYIKTSTAVN